MKVRALLDIKGSDIRAGEFFETSDTVAKFLVDDGQADGQVTEAEVFGTDTPPEAKVLTDYEPNIPSAQAAIADEDVVKKAKK